jgi:methyl-accepting chemotaxis protein/methyl-accepting chemotaxis protein-1 (serine sensor receptor)
MKRWSIGKKQRVAAGALCVVSIASAGITLSSGSTLSLWGAFFSVLTLGLGGVVLWTSHHTGGVLGRIAGDLREASGSLANASREISSTSKYVAEGANTQAASLSQISTAMAHMSSMARKNGENSAEAAAMMTETSSQVERSNSVLQEMVRSMEAIKASSEKVARIIKTIDEIAFQTNILALNAAVEAARAGEAGMGFAVVADEVRSLAQRSAAAARGTAELIEEAISSSNQGAEKLDQVASAIRAITDSASRVWTLVEEVSAASKEQTQGIEDVSNSVAEVSSVTQSAAASAEDGAASSEILNSQANTFDQLIRRLEEVSGDAPGGSIAVGRVPRTQDTPWAHARPRAKLPALPAPIVQTTNRTTKESREDPLVGIEPGAAGGFRSF